MKWKSSSSTGENNKIVVTCCLSVTCTIRLWGTLLFVIRLHFTLFVLSIGMYCSKAFSTHSVQPSSPPVMRLRPSPLSADTCTVNTYFCTSPGDTGVLFYLHSEHPNSRPILFLLRSCISAHETIRGERICTTLVSRDY